MKKILLLLLMAAGTLSAQPRGHFDVTFNNGISYKIEFLYANPLELRDMEVQPDNKILVCGWTQELYPKNAFGVVRLKENGRIDSTFGVNGKSIFRIGDDDHAESIELLPDGKILVMGNVLYNNKISGDIGLVRLNSDGSIDSTYGVNGIHQFHIETYGITGYLYDMKIDKDGGILLAGYRSSGSIKELLLMRLNPDNTLDENFGKGGYAVVKYNGDTIASQILFQSDGKIIVLGKYGPYSTFVFTAVRFHADGKVDSTFGQDGIITADLRLSKADDSFFKGDLQKDDKLVVAGSIYSSKVERNFMAMRFTTTGQVDSTFGKDGLVNVDFYNLNLPDYGQQIAIAPDGIIVIGGQVFDQNYASHYGLIAANSYGQIDPLFGEGGRGKTLRGYKMRAMRFDSKGRLVVAGQSAQDSGYLVGRFIYDSPTAVKEKPAEVIRDFTLEQNYPNPFNPETRISFHLREASKVTIAVHNTAGQQVALILNDYKEAGDHTVRFNGAGLPSGLYFYTLTAGNQKTSKKMLLLR